MTLPWHVWVGLAGMLLVLLAFFGLQARKLHGNGIIYQAMNGLGALGVLVSLLAQTFSLIAILLAVTWLLISVYGMLFNRRGRRGTREAHRNDPW